MTTRLVGTAVLAAAVFAVPASASAMVDVHVSPKSPIVDDAVTASFRTDRRLKPGYHYSAFLLAASGVDCAYFVKKDSKRRPRKGTVLSFRLSPYADRVNGGPEWCQGKAGVTIEIAKDGKDTGNIVGLADFRFRAKP